MLTEENRKDILSSFLETIETISDIEYQRRVWIHGEPLGTDFDETVNNYSLDAKGILEDYKEFRITDVQFQYLENFDKLFREFYENNNWPEEFLDTLEWSQITELAKEVLAVFDYKKA